ncbi:MAG: WG repeat-containing protein [Desulfobulbaceae bacterium]|jgi:hypothetical protein|nr:WG repeat-containing protein [Desulfobulbaceae bacterium]
MGLRGRGHRQGQNCPAVYAADFFYDGIAIISRAYPNKADKANAVDPAHLPPNGGGAAAKGLIDRDGHEILPALYDDLTRANTDTYNHPKQHGTYIPRLFLVKDMRGKTSVFRADKGFIVPPGKYEDIQFTLAGQRILRRGLL